MKRTVKSRRRLAAPARAASLAPITLGVADFRDASGLSHATIYRLLASGDLKSIKIGAKRLILMDSYQALIARRQEAAERAE